MKFLLITSLVIAIAAKVLYHATKRTDVRFYASNAIIIFSAMALGIAVCMPTAAVDTRHEAPAVMPTTDTVVLVYADDEDAGETTTDTVILGAEE